MRSSDWSLRAGHLGVAALLGYFIVPATPSGWRIVQTITAVPILLLLWWSRTLPESLGWLIGPAPANRRA